VDKINVSVLELVMFANWPFGVDYYNFEFLTTCEKKWYGIL